MRALLFFDSSRMTAKEYDRAYFEKWYRNARQCVDRCPLKSLAQSS
jgi:hypothetical protein